MGVLDSLLASEGAWSWGPWGQALPGPPLTCWAPGWLLQSFSAFSSAGRTTWKESAGIRPTLWPLGWGERPHGCLSITKEVLEAARDRGRAGSQGQGDPVTATPCHPCKGMMLCMDPDPGLDHGASPVLGKPCPRTCGCLGSSWPEQSCRLRTGGDGGLVKCSLPWLGGLGWRGPSGRCQISHPP